MAIKLKYNGKGFLSDVRAKDLTEEEIVKHGYNEKQLIASGLYEAVEEESLAEDPSTEYSEDAEALEAEAQED